MPEIGGLPSPKAELFLMNFSRAKWKLSAALRAIWAKKLLQCGLERENR
ncbi:hypothetical protein Q3C01_25300 [Bradyrhizobium sp. UFLA05-109]